MSGCGEHSPQPVLRVCGATYGYTGDRPVFADVSFALGAGDILTILGANGAGKSTLLNCLAGIHPPDAGHIFVNGRGIETYSAAELALEIAYVPQARSAAFSYSVRDYVVMGRAPYLGLMRGPGEAEYRKVDEVLRRMNVAHLRDKSCSAISGGEMQQVRIARALAQEARIILMDEPTNHLDYGNQLRVLQTAAELASHGYTLVLTTHMPDHAILLGGLAGILRPGRGLVVDRADRIVDEENLAAIYDTELRVVYVEAVGRKACLAANPRSAAANDVHTHPCTARAQQINAPE